MSVFERVKQTVTAKQIAEHYGIKVNRKEMACCPFHQDHHPSMKIGTRFHCFGCQANGDVIDFFSFIQPVCKRCCRTYCSRFWNSDRGKRRKKTHKRSRNDPVKTIEQQYLEKEKWCYNVLCDYYHLLCRWKIELAPKNPEDECLTLFCEALMKISTYEYVLDEIFINGTIMDRAGYMRDHGKEVIELEQRIAEYNHRPSDGNGRSAGSNADNSGTA